MADASTDFFEHILGRTDTATDAGAVICEQLSGEQYSSKTYFYCYHGVGHGVMMAEAYNLHAALDTCDSFPTHTGQNGCWQGVFMENVNGAMFENAGKDLLLHDDPLSPCNKIEDKYRHECYVNHAGWLMNVFENSVSEATRACLDAGNYIDSCLQSIGLMVTNPTWQAALAPAAGIYGLSYEETAWELCEAYPENYIDQCVIAGADNIINFDVGDTARANAFCRAVDGQFREICFRQVGANIRNNAVTDLFIYDSCGTLDGADEQACLQGAGF